MTGLTTYPSWSPDATRIVFNGGPGGDVIYTMPAAGGIASRLSTADPAEPAFGHDYSPAWGPTGLIAYTHVGADGIGKQPWVMTPDGSAARPLIAPDHGEDKFPTWSPDGTQIAYSHGSQGCQAVGTCTAANNYQISVVNADGSNTHTITQMTLPETEFGDSYPAWQPAGHRPPGDALRWAGR